MKLENLISDLSIIDVVNPSLSDIEINGVAEDSRQIRPGYLFVAIPGEETDGHRFIAQAVERGAAAIIGQNILRNPVYKIPYIRISNPRDELATIAAQFYGFPSKHLNMVGITGTDGKTTTTSFVHSVLSSAGNRVSMISTIGAVVDGQFTDIGVHVTTPGAVQVQSFLSDMVARGDQYAVLEVTSHALNQNRVRHCNFDVAIITNVTHEHLNYHGSYEAYLYAKSKLFRGLHTESFRKPNVPKVSILNKDDRSFEYLSPMPSDIKYSYSLYESSHADIFARNIYHTYKSTSFDAVTPEGVLEINMSLIGNHNVSNALAAIAACYSQHVPFESIAEGIAKVTLVTARMQMVDLGQDFKVYVDYAHTPNALKNILQVARTLTVRRIVLVFGLSGGLRDLTKRPIMGEIAGTMADKIVVTAVDWYSQDVGEILDEIAVGCERANRIKDVDYWCVRDRKDGIKLGIDIAEPGDVVIVAGKGHENSISCGGIEYEWNEYNVVSNSIESKLKKSSK
jgi:UDP-N-acetylmuramoyl-L-alanyl-D-glutamate--2,6-diaminopimelate ligase